MSYPAFGKVKTIVLPFSDYDWLLHQSELPIEKFIAVYKEKYGIDLSEVFKITIVNNGNNINFDLPHNTLILLECNMGVLTPIGSKMTECNESVAIPQDTTPERIIVFDTSSANGNEDGLSVAIYVYNDSRILVHVNEY